MIALKLIPLPSTDALRAVRARLSVVPFAENLVEELGFEPRFSAFQKQRERPDFPIPRKKMSAVVDGGYEPSLHRLLYQGGSDPWSCAFA